MASYRGSQSRATPDTSELTRDKSSEIFSEEEEMTSSMEDAEQGYRSTEWTDEKHCLYLKSMEASFVDQLYDSLGFLGSRSHSSKIKSSKQTYHGNGTPSGQFKVLGGGCWQTMNFKRPESQLKKRDESREFLSSAWIKHFRPMSKAQGLMSQSHEGGSASESLEIGSNGKTRNPMLCSSGSTASQKQIQIGRSQSCEQDLNACREEVSDQNFVDEDTEDEKPSSKEMNNLTEETSINDQVVPHGKTPAE